MKNNFTKKLTLEDLEAMNDDDIELLHFAYHDRFLPFFERVKEKAKLAYENSKYTKFSNELLYKLINKLNFAENDYKQAYENYCLIESYAYEKGIIDDPYRR